MWLTERTILELDYRHLEDIVRSSSGGSGGHRSGPPAVLPTRCCRFMAQLGHRLMLTGARMEMRYTDRLGAA